MQLMPPKALTMVLFITLMGSSLVLAQDQPSAADLRVTAPDTGAGFPSTASTTLTGKERLGKKWTDDQRIDNCNIPLDKRGTRPRSDRCSGASKD